MANSWHTHGKLMLVGHLSWEPVSIYHLTSTMTEPPPPKRQKKQKKKGGPIREDDPFFTAGAVTINRVTTFDSSGRRITTEIKVPLVLPKEGIKEKKAGTSVYTQEDQPDFVGVPPEEVYDEGPVRITVTRMVGLSIITGTISERSSTTLKKLSRLNEIM
jgi:hypothetical protein